MMQHIRAAAAVACMAVAMAVPARAQGTGAPASVRQVNQYFSYDSVAHSARLTIVASLDSSNQALNFNGSSGGDLAVEVPTGWTLQVRMVNNGPLRHSALVIAADGELPIAPRDPVFAGSGISPIERGLAPKAHGTMQFVAKRTGSYGIVCGVPAHAQLGMWLFLVVRDDAPVPSYRFLSTRKVLGSMDGARP